MDGGGGGAVLLAAVDGAGGGVGVEEGAPLGVNGQLQQLAHQQQQPHSYHSNSIVNCHTRVLVRWSIAYVLVDGV